MSLHTRLLFFRIRRVRVANATDLLLSRIKWLDNIGRSSRSTKNEKLENFLTDLQRLTIVHETDKDGLSQYRFSSNKDKEEGEGEEDKPKSKPKAKDKDQKDKGKGKGKGKEEEEKDGAEGDKSMSDQQGAKGAHEEKRAKDREEQNESRPRDKDGNEAAQGGKAPEV